MAFLSNIQPTPEGGAGHYYKFGQGENKFRIVGSSDTTPPGFIQGMIGWGEDEEGNRKPFRWRIGEDAPRNFAEKPREFFALVVWNYEEACVQVLELTQAGLKSELVTLANDKEWGDPRKYDIAVIRNGEGKETNYVMTPKPHKKLDPAAVATVMATSVNLEALYDGGDPFEDAPAEPAKPAKLAEPKEPDVEEEDEGEEENPF
tara:strand:+ start:294 stop:905 length:612 start_codon:yes stop_codon:yes gene_type:complete